MGQLERRAEEISGEFNSQAIANTLWAFATMGEKPGELLMGQLERRAEEISGEFNSQHVANMIRDDAWVGQLERRAVDIRGVNAAVYCTHEEVVWDGWDKAWQAGGGVARATNGFSFAVCGHKEGQRRRK
jgi:hypothetical protein